MLSPSHPIVTTSLTKWTSSLPDSLANRFQKHPVVDVKESKMKDGSGLPSSISFAKHDPLTSSWRTSQTSLTNMTHLVKYSQPWPRSGSMLNGRLFKHPKSVQTIKEIVCSSSLTDLNISTFFPTPTTANNMLSPSFLKGKSQAHRNIRAILPTPTASDGSRGSTSYGPGNLTLKGAAILLSTPTTNDATNQTFPPSQIKRQTLVGQIMKRIDLTGGNKPRLSPLFVEWMMGFNTGWTDLEPSATQLYPIKQTSPTLTSSIEPRS